MIYEDAVHFRKEELGTLLGADLLVNYLQRSVSELTAMPTRQGTDMATYTLPALTLHEKV